jgi:4-amino-4-deoxy-L-arabinose transferase-like glycosyltransferase
MRVLIFAAALYLLAPGHPDVILSGVPLGQTGTVLLILLLVCWAWTRDVFQPVRPSLSRALGVAVAIKFAIALVVPHSGWLAAYYANDQLQPPMRQSTDFSFADATRIDRQVSFVDQEFPVHFFNEHGFNFGLRREATEPFSVEWRGNLHAREPMQIRHDALGEVRVLVDGVAATTNPIAIEPGDHLIGIQYRKPPVIEGRLHVQPLDAGGAPRAWAIGEVTPIGVSPWRRSAARWLAVVAWGAHLLAAAMLIVGIRPSLAAKVGQVRALTWVDAARACVMPAVVLGLTLQGLWKARRHVDRVFTLTGGDDWLAYEMNARDILSSGWLNTRGALPGKGIPFYEYPGYGYFVAGVHWLTGESLAGVVLFNFLGLALATVLVYGIARRLTNERAALVAVAWLLVLQQMDFVRYYTVTLLSENLFFPLVVLSVSLFVRFALWGPWWTVMAAAAAGGLAAATRPTMLLYLPVAMVLLPLIRLRRDGVLRAAAIPVVVLVCWLAAISPFTYRNYVMSGQPVLITEGAAKTFIDYNLPPDNRAGNVRYLEDFRNSNFSAVVILLRILWDHPISTLQNWGTKAAFGLGMVHWIGDSRTPHPELVLTSALYLAAIFLLRDARRPAAWLVHGFIFTHLATLLLTMPSNYGYRMVLSMYLLMVVFVGGLVIKVIAPWLDRRFPGKSPAA